MVKPFDPTQAFDGEVYNPETGTWSKTEGAPAPAPAPHFDGETYDPPKDHKRLTKQLERVQQAVSDGRWYTLSELSSITGDPEGSISARLRDLRKEKFGAFDIRKQRRGNQFAYRCRGKQTPKGLLF